MSTSKVLGLLIGDIIDEPYVSVNVFVLMIALRQEVIQFETLDAPLYASMPHALFFSQVHVRL